MSQPLPLFRMQLFGAARGLKKGPKRGQKGPSFPKICHTYPRKDKNWHSYILPKEDPKNIQITWYTCNILLTSANFHQNSAVFVILENTDKICILIHKVWFFWYIEFSKVDLINMAGVLMMPVKFAFPGIIKMEVF